MILNSKRILDFGSPFGGLRHSGLGHELGPEGIDAYLKTQSVILPEGLARLPRSVEESTKRGLGPES